MAKRDFNKPIIFMHIPKTAGSTLHQLFKLNYRHEQIFTLGITEAPAEGSFQERHKASVDRFYSLNKQEQTRVKAVVGHMSYGLHNVFESDAQYITVIRHPISRILSHYNFVKDSPSYYLHDRLKHEAPTIIEYVEKLKSKELNNGMLRFFLGPEHVKIPFDGCRREMIDLALEHVEKRFVAVGVQEYFNESVDLFCDINNWVKPEVKARNIRKSQYSTELPVSEVEAILRFNSLDLLLYEELRKCFLENLKAL